MFPIRDHNPSGRTAYVTYALMAINIIVFALHSAALDDVRATQMLYLDWGLIPARLTAGEGFITLITSMFLHGGLFHLAGNMLFLYIFGDNIEDRLGHVKFLAFYLACGVLAGLAQYAVDPGNRIPMVGASGAIAGVMGAYLLLFPKARVDILIILIVFFRVLPIPAWIMLVLWFVMQFIGGIASDNDAAGVAYWAHAGGFIAGVLLILPTWIGLGGPTFWQRTHGHPPHPQARYRLGTSRVPKVTRR